MLISLYDLWSSVRYFFSLLLVSIHWYAAELPFSCLEVIIFSLYSVLLPVYIVILWIKNNLLRLPFILLHITVMWILLFCRGNKHTVICIYMYISHAGKNHKSFINHCPNLFWSVNNSRKWLEYHTLSSFFLLTSNFLLSLYIWQ